MDADRPPPLTRVPPTEVELELESDEPGERGGVSAAQTSAPTNLAQLLGVHAAEQPTAVAVVELSGGARRSLTWAELEERVDRVAGGLAGVGSVAGQRLGLLGENSLAYVVAVLAGLRAGLVVVPLDPSDPADELRARLDDAGVRLVLADPTAAVPDDLDVRPLTQAGLDQVAESGRSPVVSPADAETLAVLLRTTGTAGAARTAMITHRALLAHVEVVEAYGLTTPGTTLLAVLPFSHAFGLSTVLWGWLVSGGRLVIGDAGPAAVLAAVEQEQVSVLPVTPRSLFELTEVEGWAERLGGVGTLLSAGAPLPWRLAQDVAAATGHRVEQGYGLTEAGPGVTTTLGAPILGPGHVGRPLPGISLRIAAVGAEQDIEAGEPGRVLVRGTTLFSGYWPEGRDGPDADGWFDTGDLGYLVGEDLFLVDRAGELAVVGGFTVYPTEVEQAIRELAAVSAVAVVGVGSGPTPDRLVAFVTGSVTAADVVDFCADRLAPYKRPSDVRVVDDLPRGLTGKLRRGELRRWAEES